jgi:hypothetical protein
MQLRKKNGRLPERYNKWNDIRADFRGLFILGDVATTFIKENNPFFAATTEVRPSKTAEVARIPGKRGRKRKPRTEDMEKAITQIVPEEALDYTLPKRRRSVRPRHFDDMELEYDLLGGGAGRQQARSRDNGDFGVADGVIQEDKQAKRVRSKAAQKDEEEEAAAHYFVMDRRKKNSGSSSSTAVASLGGLGGRDTRNGTTLENGSVHADLLLRRTIRIDSLFLPAQTSHAAWLEGVRVFFRCIGYYYGVAGPIMLHHLRELLLVRSMIYTLLYCVFDCFYLNSFIFVYFCHFNFLRTVHHSFSAFFVLF